MRAGIRSTVAAWGRDAGHRLQQAGPWAIVGALVAAAIAPVAWPLAGGAGSAAVLGALFGQVGNVGAGYLTGVVTKVLDRARQAGAGESSPAQFRNAIEDELRALTDEEEGAVALRAEMAALLREVDGIDAAISAAVGAGVEEVQRALNAAFTDLSASVAGLGWMAQENQQALSRIQVEQRHQTDLIRETLVKTTTSMLLLQRHDAATRARPPAGAGETAEPTDPVEDEPAPGRCPYLGLRSFQAEDKEWFFGRERLTADLVARLAEAPLLAVVGPSGSGKSSLLRAGLLHAAWAGLLPGARNWITVVLTPTAHPLEELASQVALKGGLAAGPILADLRTDPDNLRLAIRQVLADAPADTRLLLIVDQLEEIFTLCDDEAERQRFLDALAALVAGSGCGATVVLGIRADFYARCTDYRSLVTALQDNQLLVGPMSTAELQKTITGPAERAGLVLEPGLVEIVLADVGEEPGSLPLLSHALWATWERHRGRVLTRADYQAAGGVRKAIGQTAETVYGELTSHQQGIAKDIFVRLTALGEGTQDTRRRAKLTELASGQEATEVGRVLARLVDARLVTLGQDSAEVAHEALIREWPRLRQWMNEDREGLRLHRGLTATAHEWATRGRDESILYRGARLADVSAWFNRTQPRLSDVENEFFTTSIRTQEREEHATQRRTRRLLLLVGGLAVTVVLVVFQTIQVAGERDLALSRRLAASATSQLAIDPERSLLLAQEAHKVRPTPEAEAALRQATLDSRIRATLGGHLGTVFSVVFNFDGKRVASAGDDGTVRVWDASGVGDPVVLRGPQGHKDPVYGVAFSFDGKRVASAGDDGTVRVWDASGVGDPVVLRGPQGHKDPVLGVAFSFDGKRVASAGNDGTVRVWDASGVGDPVELRGPQGHKGPVYGVAFNFDGKRVASAGNDGTVRVWDAVGVGDPVELRGPQGHKGPVYGVAFSFDGKRVVSAGEDGTVRVWDAVGVGDPVVLSGHEGKVLGVAFSFDGKWVASAGEDGKVRVWDAVGAGDPIVLPGYQSVYSVAFSPDGKRIASAGKDAMVRIWDTAVAGNPVVLPGRQSPVLGVAFSPDGKRVASAGEDGIVRVWDAAGAGKPVELPDHGSAVLGVAFSPDGKRVASASGDGMVRIWDAAGAGKLVELLGHEGTVYGVAFSPDGKRVASAGADRAVRIWDAAGAGKLVELPDPGGAVLGVAFSPDGKRVASAGADGMVRIWDAAGARKPLVVLPGHGGAVLGVAFSFDGKRIASAGVDGMVRIWDAAGARKPLVVLPGHQGPVQGVAFSFDGKRVASAGKDATVRVWDAANVGDPIILHDRRAVSDVAFSPDGKRVAGASADGMVRVWECEVCRILEEVLTLAKQRSTRELTCEERTTFISISESSCP